MNDTCERHLCTTPVYDTCGNLIQITQPALAFLMLTGLYLFVLPYVINWRSGRRISG